MPKHCVLRALVACLLLGTPVYSGATEAFGRYSNSSAIFTSNGESLSFSLVGSDLELEITPAAQATITLKLSLDQTDFGPMAFASWGVSGISISASNRVAAIGVPSALKFEKRHGVFVVLVDLETNRWGKQYFVDLSEKTDGFPQFVGFLHDSEKLAVVSDTNILSRGSATVGVIDFSDSRVTKTAYDLRAFPPVTRFFFDAGNGRVWLGFERPQRSDAKKNPSILQSLALTGEEGPSVGLADLQVNHASAKWLMPDTMAFPNLTTIIFGETAWTIGFPPNRLWIADLTTKSIRSMNLPKDIGKAMAHGLGLGWYENVQAPTALSPDGRFAAIQISQTALGPPYIVDNYVSKGSRLTIVDLQRMRVLSTIKPEHDRSPAGFALDHRDGKVTLLVSWREGGWKRLEFPESE